MMCNALTAPPYACSPDADRDGTDAPGRLPEWLVHLIAVVIRFLLERSLAAQARRFRLPSWWNYRPDLPPGSVQQLAASRRGCFGTAIVWMCHRYGIGPGHPEWPEVSRAIVAFGGSLKGLRAGAPRCPQQWWENPDIIAGMNRAPPEPVTTTASMLRRASLLLRQAVADPEAAPTEPETVLAAAGNMLSDAPLPRPLVHRAGTGPPTGPPTLVGYRVSSLSLITGAGARPAPPI